MFKKPDISFRTLMLLSLFIFFFSACEKEEEFGTHKANIRFVNHTNMHFDSITNVFRHVDMLRYSKKIYSDLNPGDTTLYKSSTNMEGILEIKAYTSDTTYYYMWSSPNEAIDPANIEDSNYLKDGYYTFSLYGVNIMTKRLYVGLILYKHHE